VTEMSTDIIIALFAATTVLLILGSFGIIFTIIHKKKQQAYQNEKKIIQTRFQEQLLQSQLEIKEQTLQYISCELHDNLGQIASLIKINLNTLQLDNITKAEQKIEDTKDLVRHLITDLKSLSVSLNSDRIIHLGILKGLENEVGRLNKTGQFESSLEQEGIIPSLDANTTIILYRMAQEIINNIVKHSKAKRIQILLQSVGNLFTLVCKDDGVGFDIEEEKDSGGAGLMNLQKRAKLINAQLFIQSSPENGTTISIELPL
jgi:signal transduction histidine kinase